MRKYNEIEEELKKLPSEEMEDERKMRNLHEIKRMRRSNKRYSIFYPVTLVVFLAVISLGYMLLTPGDSTSIHDNKEQNHAQTYFEGVEPIYSDSHIATNVPDSYRKSIAISYIYSAATFMTLEENTIHPLTSDSKIESFFDYKEDELDRFENDPLMLDYKPTVIYLENAQEYVKDEKIKQKLKRLTEQARK